MQSQKDRDYISANQWKIIVAVLATTVTLFVSAAIFASLEDWDYGDAVYFAAVTLTTVGYGDIAPSTPDGRLAGIFFVAIGMLVISYLLSGAAEAVRDSSEDATTFVF